MNSKKTVRFGVIGSSSITDSMLAGAAIYPKLQLCAVCSRTAQRAEAYAEKHGAKHTFTSPAEMAKSDTIDMVYIASPNRLHMQQATLFLQNGKHVLCEKPLTAFPDELAAAYETADRNGCMLTEAIMMCFQPQREILRQAVARLGNIRSAHFDFTQLSSKYPAYLQGETPNIFNPAMETGAMQDLGVYCVYPALYLFGMPDSITAKAEFLRTGADGACTAELHYPDKEVTLTCCKTKKATAPSVIVGEKGSLTVGAISKLENIVLHLAGETPKTLWETEEKSVLMGREIAAFADWIRTGERDAYAAHRALSEKVSACMFDIRRKAGIRFPRDVSAASRP